MNVFRSLARNLFDFMDVKSPSAASSPDGVKNLSQVRQQRIGRALELSRYRDGFEQMPQKLSGVMRTLSTERAFRPQLANFRSDGFESSASRRSPVDLSGGVKAPISLSETAAKAPVAAAPAFTASLDDLGGLLG